MLTYLRFGIDWKGRTKPLRPFRLVVRNLSWYYTKFDSWERIESLYSLGRI